jgi:hypothetical protein
MNIVTYAIQGEADDRAARVLAGLSENNHLPHFVDAIVERRDVWTVLCWLEDDLLALARRNRWCAAPEDWTLVVGRCADLDDIPAHTGYGDLQAWLEYGPDSVITICPADSRQQEDADDVLVWTSDEFAEHCNPTRILGVGFADDSGKRLNRALRQIRELEDLLTLGDARPA